MTARWRALVMIRARLIVSLVIGVSVPGGRLHAALIGMASVVDGDTVVINGQPIRLEGIDAPEKAQVCHVESVPWRCGQQAKLALRDKVRGQSVRCEQHGRDQYDRLLAVCFVGDEEVNRWLVASGWAFAYRQQSLRYGRDETEARHAKLGIWRGSVTPPWIWREQHARADGTPQGSSGRQSSRSGRACPIKGNITADGVRVYHLPGMDSYDDTRINPQRGERWFCSTAEAEAAGWRRARK